MANILEFVLRLKDHLSPAMRTAARVADSSAARMQRGMQSVTAAGNAVTRTFHRVKGALDRLNLTRFMPGLPADVRRSIRELERYNSAVQRAQNNSRGKGGALGNIMGAVRTAVPALAIGTMLAGAGAFATSSVKAAMDHGASVKSLEVLTQSPAQGQALAKDLTKFARETVLGPEVLKHAQTMLGFGVTIEKVMPSMKMLGDISMGNKDRLQALTLAFSQTTAAGRLMGQDLLQYVNAGFNPLAEISRNTGVSMAVLRKRMEEGQISLKMVEDAMRSATGEGGKFYNMLNIIAETPAGKLEQLKGAFEAFKIEVGNALMPIATQTMEWANKLLAVGEMYIPYITAGVVYIQDIITQIQTGTGEWGTWFELIKGLIGPIWSTLFHVGGIIFKAVGDLATWVTSSNLIKDWFWLISQYGSAIWWVIKGIASVIGFIFDHTIMPVLKAVEWVYTKVKELLGLGGGKDVTLNQVIKTTGTGTDPNKQIGAPAGAAPVAPPTSNAGVDSTKGINSGGSRPIIINIGKQIEKLELHSLNVREGVEDIAKMVQEELRRVLYSVNGQMAN